MTHRIPLLIAALMLACALTLRAQTPDATSADAPPPGSTVITADELHADQANHISVFNGNVMVTGTSFTMTCDEMKVLFNKEGKVDHIIASGNVVINQPGRVSHSGVVEYFSTEDKFVLTDQPVIVDNKNQIAAPKITIYRATQQWSTEGKTKVLLIGGGIGSSPSTSSSPAQ
jgi:lipopolysaccharide transport protein LptA